MRIVGSVPLGGDDRVAFGSHALYRFQKYLTPTLTMESARNLMVSSAEERGEFKLSAPEGVHWADNLRDQVLTEGWYCVEMPDPKRTGTALAVYPLVADPQGFCAMTCLVRWG